jgi:hypothetical protein
MALYHKWDVKIGFAYVLTFFSLISGGLGSVINLDALFAGLKCKGYWNVSNFGGQP